MDAQELVVLAADAAGGFLALGFEGREEDLEPFEGRGVFADPDELDAAETGGRVRAVTHVPDVLEDGGPGCDSDTCADEDGDFVVEDVFGGCSVWTVDAEFGHGLTVLESDFVHAVLVDAVVQFGLGGSGSECITESAGEVSDLTDVD